MAVAKERIRQIIADKNLRSVTDVHSLLKDNFKDILSIAVGTMRLAVFGWGC